MSVTVEAKPLADAVAWARQGLSTNASIPVLKGMRVFTEEDVLVLEASNHDVHSRARVRATGELEERALVLGEVLTSATRKIGGDVDLSVDGAGSLVLKGDVRYKLWSMPDGAYPTLPHMPEARGFAPGLADAVASAAVAVASGPAANAVPGLACVRLRADGGTLFLEATDRYRAARAAVEWDGPPMDVLVNARRFAGLCKPLGDAHLGFDGSRVAVSDGWSRAASLRTTAGDPINLERLFAMERPDMAVDVEREALLGALEATEVTMEGVRHAELVIEGETLTLKSANGSLGVSTAEVSVERVGDTDCALHVCTGYLGDAVRAMHTDVVRVHPAGPRLPMLISPVTDGEPDFDNSHVVMPVRKA